MSIPSPPGASPFWAPSRHADRRPRLLARARIVDAVRGYFRSQDFLEVEPACLQFSPGNETHLHGFATEMIGSDGCRHRAYLHTSPEFAMKKLLAAGERRIFALARVFRNRERGALHAPEFTMLEWYRVGEPPEALERDCAALLQLAAEAAGSRRFVFRGREADPFAEPERLTVREAFLRYAGIDIFDASPAEQGARAGLVPVIHAAGQPLLGEGKPGLSQLTLADIPERRRLDGRDEPGLGEVTAPAPAMGEGRGGPDRQAFAAAARSIGVRVAPDDSWSDIFSRVLSERVEPNLGLGRATILCEYPASEAALARLNPREPRVAERFELYACGVELANAFGELTDAAEQRSRFEEDMALKQAIYGERYPIDEDFLAALEAMPEASGAALGLDRLAMLACGAERIEDVQWTPVFDPEAAQR